MVSIKFNNHYNNNNKDNQLSAEIDIDNCKITNYDPANKTPSGAGDMTLNIQDGNVEYKRGQSIFSEDVKLNEKKYSVFTKIASMDANSSNLTQQDLSKARKDYDTNRNIWIKLGVTAFRYDPNAGIATIKFGDKELLRIDFMTEKEKPAQEEQTQEEQTQKEQTQKTDTTTATKSEKLSTPKVTEPATPEDIDLSQPFTTYCVESNDTLWSISQKTGAAISAIKALNGIEDENVRAGETLKIPKDAAPNQSNLSVPLEILVDEKSNRKYVVVQQNDTIHSISERLGISKEKLLEYNPLITDETKINVSDELWVDPQEEQPEQEEVAITETQANEIAHEAEKTCQTIIENGVRKPVQGFNNVLQISAKHTIKNGETLSEIALKYDIPLEVLKRDNNIKNANTITAGTVLTINYFVYEIQKYGTSEQIANQIYKTQEERNDLKLEIEALNNVDAEYSFGKGALVRLPNNIIKQKPTTAPKIDKQNVKKSDKVEKPIQAEQTNKFEKNFKGYKQALAMKESSNRQTKVNRYGYIGLYQFGEMQLADIGLYSEKNKGYGRNDWSGVFKKNPYGITSKSDLLSSREKQDKVLAASMKKNWGYIKSFGLDKYVGKTYKGIKITKSGLLAGAHLVGIGGVKDFLQQGIDKEDGNHVPVSKYIRDLGGYNVDEALI